MKLDDIKREIACRPDEAVLTLNNLITVGDLRRLIAENERLHSENDILRSANDGLGTRLLRTQELETWQRTICELLAPSGDEVRPEDAHSVVSCLRETLADEEERHAQLQERCFGHGGQSVFDEVKQLRTELADFVKESP